MSADTCVGSEFGETSVSVREPRTAGAAARCLGVLGGVLVYRFVRLTAAGRG